MFHMPKGNLYTKLAH